MNNINLHLDIGRHATSQPHEFQGRIAKRAKPTARSGVVRKQDKGIFLRCKELPEVTEINSADIATLWIDTFED